MGTIITPTGPRLMLVRHGQCETNVYFDLSTYRAESDVLTAKGRDQAKQAGIATKRYLGPSQPVLVSSTLIRATQTAKIIAELLGGIEIRFDDRLSEMSSIEDEPSFLLRTSAVINELMRYEHDCVAITHGHVIQNAIALSLKIDYANTKGLYPFNGGLTVLRGGVLESFNLHQHIVDAVPG